MATSPSGSASASSVRADAISRLKRAASLPRMKDGRRPAIPANGGAFSEGGKSEESSQRGADTPTYGYGDRSHSDSDVAALDASREDEPESGHETVVEMPSEMPAEDDLPTPMPREDVSGLHHVEHNASAPPHVTSPETEAETLHDSESVAEHRPTDEDEEHYDEEQHDEPNTDLMAQQLLLNMQLRALASVPAAFQQAAFPTGYPPSAFPQNVFQSGLVSPQMQNAQEMLLNALVQQQQQQQQQMSPQQHRAYLPPASPVGWQQRVKSPASPLPTLNDIAAAHQRGLFRSNSAAARTEAYNKLTGGRDTPSVSQPPSVLGYASTSRLGRSNTVTGGERLAAGGRMVGVISRRRQQEDQNRAPSALDMTTSAGEESSVSVTTREERRSRRRRRHSSQSKAIVDDRDVPTNAPSTPAASATPLPQDDIPPLPRPESLSSTSVANALRQSIERRVARENSDYEYGDVRERQTTPGPSSKPGTDIDTDTEIPPLPQSPLVPLRSAPPLANSHALPTTPSISGLPFPNPQFFTPLQGHASDVPSNTSSSLMDMRMPVYLATGSLSLDRDSYPQTISGTPFSTPYKSPRTDEYGGAAHRAATPGDDSATESPWNLGTGSEFQGGLGGVLGRNLMDQIDDIGEALPEAEAEVGQVLLISEPPSPVPDSAVTVVPHRTPSPLPMVPVSAPATIAAMTSQQVPFPAASPARSPVPRSATRDVLSDISYTSVPPASTPHRSRTESIGFSDLDTAITDGETTGREDKPKKPRSGSNFSDKVKSFLSHMSSRSAMRQRTISVSSRHERQQKGDSSHSSEILSQKFESSDNKDKAENRESRDKPNSRESLQKPETEVNKERTSAPIREDLLLKSVSTVSLASQASPNSGKSLMDVTNPLPQGSISPMPPPSAAQIAKYNSVDKLLPFPGMLRLEQERSKFRTFSPPTSPIDLSFSPPATLSPPQDPLASAKASSMKLSTPSPGMTILDLPAVPNSAPPVPGTLGERMGDRQLHYIDLPDNLLSGSDSLPTTRRGVQQWLRMKKSSPNDMIQKKSSLTDLLSSGMLTESGTEREDGAGLFGKLSIGRSLNKKPSRPRVADRQDGRPGTAPSAVNVPAVPAVAAAHSAVGGPVPPAPVLPLPITPPEPSFATIPASLPEPPALDLPSTSAANNSLASLAAAAAIVEEKANNYHALASLAAAAAIPDQPEGSHSSVASDPSGPNSRNTDISGSALSTPSVSQETSSASQPSLDSPPLVEQPRLNEAKGTGTVSKAPAALAYRSTSPAISAKPPPPRKLLLHSQVLQVVQGDRLKERHLFLFSDILVIAKPDPRALSAHDKSDPASLSRPLLVKSIVELRNLRLKPQQDHTEPTKSDKHRSTIRAFADEFAEDPISAVEKLAQRAGIEGDPAAIADVLFETPSLDKRQLGEYLCLRSSRHVLRAFIDRFGFEDVRIDIALRTFLLSIILPDQEDSSDHLLNNFAARWWHANSRTIGFDRELSTRLVLAMIQLSDALHSASYSTPGRSGAMSPSKPRLSVHEWIETFRIRDHRQLVPEMLLRAIYTGISRFRIAEALDSNSDSEVPAAMIPARMKTRLTHGEPSERIHIRIPRPDRNFALRLYGHGLKFDPEYLDFSNSTEQSFVIFPTTVGQKTIIFGREGGNSAFYTGVPLSKTVLVERAFMKNTFQLAFVNHLGVKRKYLFSMDDLFRVTEWTNALTSEINKRRSMDTAIREKDIERKTAADVIAFVMLRDTLLPREEKEANSSAADTSAASLSRLVPPKSAMSKEAPSGDRPYSGTQIIQICIQNSLLSGMILRSKPPKWDGAVNDLEKRTSTPRVASPLAMTPRMRPSGVRMI
ncbi:hypothetical protein CALCODRAFT_450979 [Calocera cornea HHB12733]|uniref:SEC7 domain-containing protein n=1 Tax=Calocera cornea HHB12733 TaxID=1353952 RepID=A0A165H5Q6_9BASI|nr:hypothetical protein CALCODRAFT_450979 [Calocera cornea HHB12733]